MKSRYPLAMITRFRIIAQRTASITWRKSRQTDADYAINDIDPISGQQRYPTCAGTTTAYPLVATPKHGNPTHRPTDPGIRPAMREQLIANACAAKRLPPCGRSIPIALPPCGSKQLKKAPKACKIEQWLAAIYITLARHKHL